MKQTFFLVFLFLYLSLTIQAQNFHDDGKPHIETVFDYNDGRDFKESTLDTENVFLISDKRVAIIKTSNSEGQEFELRIENLFTQYGTTTNTLLAPKKRGGFTAYLFLTNKNEQDLMYQGFAYPKGRKGRVQVIKYETPYIYLKFTFETRSGMLVGICERIKYQSE